MTTVAIALAVTWLAPRAIAAPAPTGARTATALAALARAADAAR